MEPGVRVILPLGIGSRIGPGHFLPDIQQLCPGDIRPVTADHIGLQNTAHLKERFQIRKRQRPDCYAAFGNDPNQSLLLQPYQRFPDRCPADPKIRDHGGLAEYFSRTVVPGQDPSFYFTVGLFLSVP